MTDEELRLAKVERFCNRILRIMQYRYVRNPKIWDYESYNRNDLRKVVEGMIRDAHDSPSSLDGMD